MAFTQSYTFMVRDGGTPAPGLTPTFDEFSYVDGSSAGSLPTVSDLGNGVYSFEIDWTNRQVMDICYVIDADVGIVDDNERYVYGVASVSNMQIALLFHLAAGRVYTDVSTGKLRVFTWDGSVAENTGAEIGDQQLKDGFADGDNLDNSSVRIVEKKAFTPL